MFRVMRCFDDGYEVWKTEVAVFETEEDAENWSGDETQADAPNVWYEIQES